MPDRIKPAGYGTGEYEDRRSRFIGELWPVRTEDEARAHLDAVKKKYPDARHHCWVWILPDGALRWSDDGEPGGTAGAPMADILRNAGVTGVVCVVTRYFGGTLLGSGGLVRAYSRAAQLALSDAGTEADPDMAALTLRVPWDLQDRVHRLVRELDCTVTDTDYAADPNAAVLTVTVRADAVEGFSARFVNVTGGRGSVAD